MDHWLVWPGYSPVRRRSSTRRRGYRCPVRFEVDWIHFRARDLRTEAVIGRLDGGVAWAAEEWEFWRPVYTRLHELSKPDSKLLRARVQAMLLYFIAGVIDEHHASQEHASLMDVVNRMSPAVEFMDRHFLDNPGLDQIAASVKLSPTHFHRAFRAAFRTTPHAYMLRKRMDLAWSLLAEGELNVNEVADRLRYVNVFYFSRVFKAYFDAAPSKVRSNRSAGSFGA